jgi:hypothetical protein
MNRAIDVKTEMRKLASHKLLQATAGVGVLASEALRELPGRIAGWRPETPVTALPGRASEIVTTARAKVARGYDHLAVRGERALSGKPGGSGGGARSNGSAQTGSSARSSQNAQGDKSAISGKTR